MAFNLLGEVDEEELKLLCSKKYGRPFKVVLLTGPSVEAYSFEYKIKYYIGKAGKPVESLLDLHLRVGFHQKTCLGFTFYMIRKEANCSWVIT